MTRRSGDHDEKQTPNDEHKMGYWTSPGDNPISASGVRHSLFAIDGESPRTALGHLNRVSRFVENRAEATKQLGGFGGLPLKELRIAMTVRREDGRRCVCPWGEAP
jgi:hypothetical protein